MGPAPSLSRSRPGDWGRNDLDRFTGAIHSNSHCADSLRPGSWDTFTSSYSPSWYAESKSGHACCHRDHGFPQHGLLWGRSFSPIDADFNPRSEYAYRRFNTHRCYPDLDDRFMVAGKTGSPARTPPARNDRSAPGCSWSRWHCMCPHSWHSSGRSSSGMGSQRPWYGSGLLHNQSRCPGNSPG